MWRAWQAAASAARCRPWLGPLLLGGAALGAVAQVPAQIDNAWRLRQAAVAERYWSDRMAQRRSARAAMDEAGAAGDLRRGFWAMAAYLRTFDALDPADCKRALAPIEQAERLGPAYRPELFDLLFEMAINRGASGCGGTERLGDIKALAESLGDPARLHFHEMAAAQQSGVDEKYLDAAQHFARARDLAPGIDDIQDTADVRENQQALGGLTSRPGSRKTRR